MRDNLIASVQQFVENSTLEISERVAIAFEACENWSRAPKLPYIPAPKLHALLNQLVQDGRDSGRSPTDIAFALRAACALEARHRETPQIELVLSGPAFPPFEMRRTDEAIIQIIQSAQRRLTLISFALYRIDRIAQTLEIAANRNVDIRMYVELDTLKYGDISALYGRDLAAHMEMYVWSSTYRQTSLQGRSGVLHAKATIADSDQLFISSANLTEHAMSLNIELGVFIRGGNHARKIEQLFHTYLARGLFTKLTSVS